MPKKIIVAGGGHGGIAAAALLAKQGFDVTVYEKNSREDMGHDWTDIFDKKGLFAVGLGMPSSDKHGYKNDMTFYDPTLEHRLRQHTPEDQLEIQMERKDIYDMLISYAVDCGVKFEFGVCVNAPVMCGSRVVGIKTDKGEFYGELVIDACGLDSPVRKNLPSYLGITKEARRFEQFYVYRAFYERTADIPEDNFKVILFHNNILGISWVAIEEEHTDILIGRFDPLTEEDVEKTLAALRETQPALGKKKLRGGQFVKIPVRQPLGLMVADGYAAIGDSAFMTVPLIGSGIANSLKAAKMLADAICRDVRGEYSAETLYEYQKEFFKNLGSGLAPIACVKLLLTKLSPGEVTYLLSSGVLTADDVTMGADTTSIFDLAKGLTVGSLPARATALIKDKVLLKKIGAAGVNIASAIAVCAAMPNKYNKKALALWTSAYDKCFNAD